MLKRDVLVLVKDLLSGSSDVRRLIFSAKAWDHDDQVVHHSVEAPRVQAVKLTEDAEPEALAMAFCPETDVRIRDQPLRALLDTGAEANVISH